VKPQVRRIVSPRAVVLITNPTTQRRGERKWNLGLFLWIRPLATLRLTLRQGVWFQGLRNQCAHYGACLGERIGSAGKGHMDPRAVEKANRRLNSAKKSVEELRQCKTMEQFHDAWFSFLTASKSVYTALETGSKVSAQSKQWYGAKARERRDDELLQYVYQARNDDEHGLGPIVEEKPGMVAIGSNRPGYSQRTRISLNVEGGKVSISEATPRDDKPVLVELLPAYVALAPVTARGNRIYPPPTRHLGGPLTNNRPLPVAELMVAYLEGILAEAGALP